MEGEVGVMQGHKLRNPGVPYQLGGQETELPLEPPEGTQLCDTLT